MARESHLERQFNLGVRQAGGMSIKMVPTVAGIPDRLVLLPGGRTVLVELKAENGALHEIQRVWHDRAAAIGHDVVVLRGRAEMQEWLDELDLPVNERNPYLND